ncbi:von Hippel-Lindau disease tumor suppressor, beta domain [Planctomycetales bacterium 10988]|nr:von Hippel-Lindau disease tumor suppressor, beta domain [Planctomycetales bacterium 10988]
MLVMLLETPGLLWGGGSEADYQRAADLAQTTRQKVFRKEVVPHWQPDGKAFWYKVFTAPQEWEYVFVDCVKGTRELAFDHQQLAQQLRQQGFEKAKAKRLPLDSLSFQRERKECSFTWQGKGWVYNIPQNKLAEGNVSPASLKLQSPESGPRFSERSGEATTITFENQSEVAFDLYWFNYTGQRQWYKTLKPGSSHQQSTYAGHVWLLHDDQQQPRGIIRAPAQTVKVTLDQDILQSKIESQTYRPPPASKRSPNGKWKVEVRGHNLQLVDLNKQQSFPLTKDGVLGDAYWDLVYWSPDSSKVLTIKRKDGDKRQVRLIESAPKDQLQPKLHTFTYLKPGDKVQVNQPRLFEVKNQQEIPIENSLFKQPYRNDRFRWAADSSAFTFIYNRRGHQVLRLLKVDAESGEVFPLIEEKSQTFIDYAGKFYLHFLDESQEVIWMSERDGWNHLYLIDLNTGKVKQQLTQGKWVVRGVDRIDPIKRQAWFRAGGIDPQQDPYYIHYCRVNFDGTGLVDLTPGDGTHEVEYSPDGTYLLDRYSRVDLPPVTELRSVEDRSYICSLEKADATHLLKTGWKFPQRFVSKARDGETDIYGVIFLPSNKIKDEKVPVIEQIYAGPQGAFVPKDFMVNSKQQELAELGFVVVQIDGMGTSYRSKAFHDVCWENLGDAGFPDRRLWMEAAAKKYPQMDLTRVGIYGGSAGGQSALRALLMHGDFYHVGVSDCGCHDNRMDKIWWNELWMGWPIGSHYEEQSNVTQAHRLQGKLLLIVGELDRNVDPASTMQVVDALIKADKDFDLLVIPGAGHGAGASPYGVRRLRDFFVRHLLKVEPRQ